MNKHKRLRVAKRSDERASVYRECGCNLGWKDCTTREICVFALIKLRLANQQRLMLFLRSIGCRAVFIKPGLCSCNGGRTCVGALELCNIGW
jgi:hypothetical protein